MSTQVPCLRADSRTPARYASIQRQLRQFAPEMRPAVFAVARRHIRLAELSLSFPALLAALAYPRSGIDRHHVIGLAIEGFSLPVLAERAGVPLWLRRMPPRLLVAPLPVLPDSAFLRHRLVNHFPYHPAQSAHWFGAVANSGQWVHEDFTVWCARNYALMPREPRGRRRRRGRNGVSFRLLCLWAWYSMQPHSRAHELMETPWTPDMEMGAACTAAYDWRESLELEITLGSRRVDDNWLQPGSVDGYTFTPLCSAAEIDAEGRAMRNCLRTYGDSVALGDSRLWSVRRDGARIATLEIGRMGRNPLPIIRQLRLSENDEPPADLWLSVHRWFQAQEIPHFSTPPSERTIASLDRATWQQLWKPFWLAKRCIPAWLPLTPSMDAL
jgi:hypothetical protein